MEKYKKKKKFNFKVSYTMTLQTSINKLWSIISSESNLEFYHPFCKKNIVINLIGQILLMKFTIKNISTRNEKWKIKVFK